MRPKQAAAQGLQVPAANSTACGTPGAGIMSRCSIRPRLRFPSFPANR